MTDINVLQLLCNFLGMGGVLIIFYIFFFEILFSVQPLPNYVGVILGICGFAIVMTEFLPGEPRFSFIIGLCIIGAGCMKSEGYEF